MDVSRLFGRTSFGTQEILQKSGRLTQSERLVLIVLGDQIAFPSLLGKLSALSPERIEQALVRLIELNLAYEIVAPASDAVGTATIPVTTLKTFLAQSESDPVTVMASAEQKEATAHARALNASVGEVLESAVARAQARSAPPVAVPLSKLFPEDSSHPVLKEYGVMATGSGSASAVDKAFLASHLPVGQGKVLEGTAAPSMSTIDGTSLQAGQSADEVEALFRSEPTPAGSWTLLIGGAAAVAIFGALLIYLLR